MSIVELGGVFMKPIIGKLFNKESLTRQEARQAMDALMSGSVSPVMVAAFLGALRGKGESVEEICGFAQSMRNHAAKIPLTQKDLVDTCGTGGDGADTFNISTAAAFVLAAAGLYVVKHGNRSVSSLCGSADVLEALGVKVDESPLQVAKSVEETGFGFLFAKTMHPSMKHVAPVRKELSVRTVFNLLGPLTNPAFAKRQVIGVYDKDLLEKMAHVLKELGSEEVMLVHGADGLDEVTLTDKTYVAHLKEGKVESYAITPEDFGFERCSIEDLKGGDASENARILTGILKGEIKGPKRDIVVMNGACALMVAGKAGDFLAARKMVESLLDNKKAYEVLEKVRAS